MTISSRTPEGRPNECPVCGKRLVIEPSEPTGDAPCPHCGVLLWFAVQQPGLVLFGRAETQEPSPEESAELAKSAWDPEILGPMPVAGDLVRVTQGAFSGCEGPVIDIDRAKGRVTVEINVFGRAIVVPVSLERVARAD
jgi:hypothetical protein